MAYVININSVDKTSLLKAGTLNIQKGADNRSSCSLSLLSDSTYVDIIGHDLQVVDGATVIFGGVIKTVGITKLEPGAGTTKQLLLDITSNGYNDIPARRTTTSVFENQTAGYIVAYMLSDVLNAAGADDNIGTGTISSGATLTAYSAICKSVKQVLDDMAEASGYKWYINDAREMMFVAEDTVTDAAHDLVEGGEFTDYAVDSVEISMDDYRNKQFVRGGKDASGNTVIYILEDTDEITARQTSEGAASSGVYGNTIDESSITNATDAAAAAENALKKYGFAPSTIEFSSFTNDWIVGTKLKVNLPTFGISADTYYLIESLKIRDVDGLNLQSTLTATKRKADDFSTQRSENYIDYFGDIIKKKDGVTGSSAGIVQQEISVATNADAVSVTTSEAIAATKDITLASLSKVVVSFSCEITISGGAANVTAKTYFGSTAQTYQPSLYCAGANTYVLTYVDYATSVAAGDYTISVKLATDANTGSVAIGHARLVVQAYPDELPFFSDPTGFSLTVAGSSEIDTAWTNPTEDTFTEVELYRHTSSLANYDRAWCDANATAVYNGTDTSHNDTGLSSGTKHYYKIFAKHTIDGTNYYSVGISASATTEFISYQDWSNYPDSPDATSAYPCQFVLIISGNVWLYECAAPVFSSEYAMAVSGNGAFLRYLLNGGAWEYNYSGSGGMTTPVSPSAVPECNADIYTSSALTTVWKYKTTA